MPLAGKRESAGAPRPLRRVLNYQPCTQDRTGHAGDQQTLRQAAFRVAEPDMGRPEVASSEDFCKLHAGAGQGRRGPVGKEKCIASDAAGHPQGAIDDLAVDHMVEWMAWWEAGKFTASSKGRIATATCPSFIASVLGSL